MKNKDSSIKIFVNINGKKVLVPVKNITVSDMEEFEILCDMFNDNIYDIHNYMLNNLYKGSKTLEIVEAILKMKK